MLYFYCSPLQKPDYVQNGTLVLLTVPDFVFLPLHNLSIIVSLFYISFPNYLVGVAATIFLFRKYVNVFERNRGFVVVGCYLCWPPDYRVGLYPPAETSDPQSLLNRNNSNGSKHKKYFLNFFKYIFIPCTFYLSKKIFSLLFRYMPVWWCSSSAIWLKTSWCLQELLKSH